MYGTQKPATSLWGRAEVHRLFPRLSSGHFIDGHSNLLSTFHRCKDVWETSLDAVPSLFVAQRGTRSTTKSDSTDIYGPNSTTRNTIFFIKSLEHVGYSWGWLGEPALPTLECTNVTFNGSPTPHPP